MLKVTVTGKLDPEKVIKVLKEHLGRNVNRHLESFPELKHALAQGIIVVEVEVTVKKNSGKPMIILEKDGMANIEVFLKNAALVYDEVSMKITEVDSFEEPPSVAVTTGALSFTMEELGLSNRAQRCTDREGIQTVGDLIERTANDLLQLRNFGKTTLSEVRDKLQTHGLKLKGD